MTTLPALTSFSLRIPGPPQGQGRPRFGKGITYTDPKTRSYAQQIQGEWIAAGRPVLPSGPYELTVYAYFARPASHRGKNGRLSASARRTPYPGKPDLDNIVKGVLDALVSVGAIPDDRYLVDLAARKEWTDFEVVPPGVLVDVRSMAEEAA